MNANDIKEYARRDWARIAELDRCYWAEQYRQHGAEIGLQVAAIMREHIQSIRPEWPDAAEREADFQHHVRFRQLLEQAANGRSPG